MLVGLVSVYWCRVNVWFCSIGMVAAMDEAVGKIRDLFKKYEMWDETVLAFSTGREASFTLGLK